jgi:hypothetical protein
MGLRRPSRCVSFRSSDFVADALAGNFALELGERKQHVERQTPHAGGGVESLGHRDERHVMFVEQLDELGEVGHRIIGKRVGEAVELDGREIEVVAIE